jgi:hypothetical protein
VFEREARGLKVVRGVENKGLTQLVGWQRKDQTARWCDQQETQKQQLGVCPKKQAEKLRAES